MDLRSELASVTHFQTIINQNKTLRDKRLYYRNHQHCIGMMKQSHYYHPVKMILLYKSMSQSVNSFLYAHNLLLNKVFFISHGMPHSTFYYSM